MNRTIDERVAAIAAMSHASVIGAWEQERAQPAPSISPSLLARDLAYSLQASVHGGLDRRLSRHLDQLCKQAEDDAKVAVSPPASLLGSGSTLLREWNGKTHRVTVTDDGGYLYDGKRYRSLSVIARTITGTRWSGPRFFGVPR